MFERSADLYDALYEWKDYDGECERLRALIHEANPHATTLLDVACGTGLHLERLARWFDAEGLDLDEGLLAVARRRLPGLPLHRDDMVNFDLGKVFDVVTCLFSSIGYVETVERLTAAIASMARHVAPGGLLIVEPWFSPETFEEGHLGSLFVERPELRIARMILGSTEGGVSLLRLHYLVGTPEAIRYFEEDHRLGLFGRSEHEDAFRAAGLEVTHDPEGLMGRGLYCGRKGA